LWVMHVPVKNSRARRPGVALEVGPAE
ncbi:MAG: hypothetical protein QOK14_1698, partial [Frankiaceae bacterium]|nr:hypothetical protein [Frankiaceae bacterium]